MISVAGVESIVDFLSHLRSLDIRIELQGERLSCTAPKGVLTPELTLELKSRKPEIIEFLRDRRNANTPPPIERVRRDGYFAPSTGQKRLWFLGQFDPDSAAYNIVGCMRLSGSLNREALERSIREIVRRHEVLRTSIVSVEGVPMAVVREVDWTLGMESLRDVAPESQTDRLKELASAEARKPFDLSSAPLLRAILVDLGADEHALVISIHHIAADGWSLGVFGAEFAALYQNFLKGEQSALPELPIQFADYAQWHQDHVESGIVHAEVAYWRRQLAPPVPPTDLPTDRPRPAAMTFNGTRMRQVIGAAVWESAKQFSLAENVTPFVTLLAAFKLLIQRYTGQHDVVVGSVSAGRTRRELEPLIGLFINNLVLRSNLEGNPTVRELVSRIRDTVLGAFSNEHVALDRLVEILQVPRALDRPPLFQLMFIFQNMAIPKMEFAGLKLEGVRFDAGWSRYDLTIEAGEGDGQLVLEWEYNTDLFDASSIERFQRHFGAILEQLVASADQRISEIEILSAHERRAVLDSAGGRPIDPLPAPSVHAWVEQEAAQHPDKVAVESGSSTLSYGELSARSNRLARWLQSLGVGPDQLVGLCVERSADMLVGLLGIMKAGGAYVPLDPQFPKDRLSFMLEDSGAKVLITESHLKDLAAGAQVVCLDKEDWQQESSAAVESGVGPENLAYVIYTSGSTGKPKGVEITHRSVVNLLASMQREPGMKAGDRLLAVTTLSFDIAGLELYLPLVSGGQVVIAPRAVVGDGAALAELLEQSRANVMQATPVTWRLMLEAGWRGRAGMKILCGGEALPLELAHRLLETGAEVWNLYGPTETTIWSTVQRMEAGAETVAIGRPVANTQVYVLDENRQLAPAGVSGELYIGGQGVARGYWRRPELTGERFLEDPFWAGQRIYRTGDVARWRRDGTLECLGRVDHQVKVRGYRIELGEIESALEQIAGIRQAVAIVREDVPGDPRLVAYVVTRNRAIADPRVLRETLQAQLPDYMVPTAFVTLDAFPLTPNKKVDRKALPAPDNNSAASAVYVPPSTESERRVAELWQGLLGKDRIGVLDNFFDLGGHSLLAAQLQSRLKQRLGCEISLVELFQHPTVAAIATLMDARRSSSPAAVRN
jgi:amino acid adenylation domain-containing protein